MNLPLVNNRKSKPDRKTFRALGVKFIFAILSLIILASSIVGTVLYAGFNNVEQFKSLGTWGDFTGGLLNPILTFITFIGVILTIILQRIELSLTREEMIRSADALEAQSASIDKQNFEFTFFEMLKLHNSIVISIETSNLETSTTTTGRDSFRVFYTRFTKIYRANKEKGANNHTLDRILNVSYHLFWKETQLKLGHYYRFLYNFVKFIDENEGRGTHYIKLLRSQLSDQELLLLYYNCASNNGEKFRKYAEKYALFDNMPTFRLLEKFHVNLLNSDAFGNNPMLTSKQMWLK